MGSHRSVNYVVTIRLHSIGGYPHIVEHALEFLGELVAAFDFQFSEHASFRVI